MDARWTRQAKRGVSTHTRSAPPCCRRPAGARLIPALAALALLWAGRAEARVIEWSGRTWQVRDSAAERGPGPNSFSAGEEHVWVDAAGALHLRIAVSEGRWRCAQIALDRPLGYGTYAIQLDGSMDDLDPQAVLALFIYRDDRHEIDIEASHWGDAHGPLTLQYVVQPGEQAGNRHRFELPATRPAAIHAFNWLPARVDFQSQGGAAAQRWVYGGHDAPVLDGEVPIINLWLFQGRPPRRQAPVEVVIRSFEFTPAPTQAVEAAAAALPATAAAPDAGCGVGGAAPRGAPGAIEWAFLLAVRRAWQAVRDLLQRRSR